MRRSKLGPEALEFASKLRNQGQTLADIAFALKRDLGITVTVPSLSKRLRKVGGAQPSRVGRPRKEPGTAEPSGPQVVTRPAMTPALTDMRLAAKERAEAGRGEMPPVPELPPEGCTLEELRNYEAARLRWELARADILDAEAFAAGDKVGLAAIQKLRAVLRGELRSLIPPEPPDPALDPANTKARDLVLAWIEDMVPREATA